MIYIEERMVQLLIKSILRHKLLVLTMVLVCTLLGLVQLPDLRFNSEYINLLPPKVEHLELSLDVLGRTAQESKDLYCLFEGDDMFSMQALNALQAVLADIQTIEGLKPPPLGPLFHHLPEKGDPPGQRPPESEQGERAVHRRKCSIVRKSAACRPNCQRPAFHRRRQCLADTTLLDAGCRVLWPNV